jgi:peptidoglycan hydrolase-like protein with peptidoglycan-binding domain
MPTLPPAKGTVAEAVARAGVLRLGDQSEDVRTAQLALARLGYVLKGTGYFGPATDAAVSAFQRHHGLTIDGVIGPDSAGVLDAAIVHCGSRPPWDGSARGSSRGLETTPSS